MAKKSILIVHDDFTVLKSLYSLLSEDYQVMIASDCSEAQLIIKKYSLDMFICALSQRERNSYNLVENLDSLTKRNTKIIFLIDCFNEFDNDKLEWLYTKGIAECVPNNLSIELLIEKIKYHFSNNSDYNKLARDLRGKDDEIAKKQDAMLNSLILITEFRDSNTAGHVKRTKLYTEVLINKMFDVGYAIDKTYAANIIATAPLHDVGKIAISDTLLHKPTKFTYNEYELAKLHVIYGHKIISNLLAEGYHDNMLEVALELVFTHHEKWDGTGYPNNLEGVQIPLSGRIMAIADVYDALLASRAYKKELTHEKATRIMLEEKGKSFDPDLVDIFYSINNEFDEIQKNFRFIKSN